MWYTEYMKRNKKSPQTYTSYDQWSEIDIRDKDDKIIAKAIIDNADLAHCLKFKWCLSSRYAYGYSKGKFIMMHRHIMNPSKNMQVDHINHDRLDNRRSNLRVCTQSDNNKNHSNHTPNKYLGVRKSRDGKSYTAHISHENKFRHIGTYKTTREAAIARDQTAKQLHGEFAVLNFGKS